MKKILFFFFLFLSYTSIAQNDIIGSWKFDKLSRKFKADSLGKAMMSAMLKDYKIDFESTNYRMVEMGQERIGTWKYLDDGGLEFSTSRGFKLSKKLKFISADRFVFIKDGKEFFELVRTSRSCKPIVLPEKKNIGLKFEQEKLIGIWSITKVMKENGEEIGLTPIYKKGEPSSWEFKKNGKFISKSILKIKTNLTWEIGEDEKSIIIHNKEYDETRIVLELTDNNLRLFVPATKQTFAFERKK